jgi:hypothetical protein
VRSGPRKKLPKTNPQNKKCSGQQRKEMDCDELHLTSNEKTRSPSSGQNSQLVHWWLLVHSGPTYLVVASFANHLPTSPNPFSHYKLKAVLYIQSTTYRLFYCYQYTTTYCKHFETTCLHFHNE